MGIFHVGIEGLNDREVVTRLRGQVFAEVPGQPLQLLFGCHGFTVSRPISSGGGSDAAVGRVAGREALLWTDPTNGSVLDQWLNPLTGTTVEVLHDWLDPMNVDSSSVPTLTDVVGTDTQYVWNQSSVSASPLRVNVYKREVASATLEYTEMVRFDRASKSLSIVRMHPWLPWMLMGHVHGRLVVHLGGRVIDAGFAGLPDDLRTYVMANRPEFAYAPHAWQEPNENSWSMYGKERHPAK
jgi:hypothetical protein